jgi:uncharacterized protein YprB with RNaseH-like and TPR domain
MPSPVPVHNILFLDIETVSQEPAFDRLPEEWKELWTRKAEILLRNKEEETIESIYSRAAIYAEFGKVICISCGLLQVNGDEKKLVLKSFYADDEKTLLREFADLLRKWAIDGSKFLCAHNGREFDFPYLCRRMVINGIGVPAILFTPGRKPWEICHIDTMDLWKFGDFKNYTSLNLLAYTLGVPTSKDDIDGSMVGEVYWKENNLQRIVTYCQKDVITVAQVYLRIYNETLIAPENIEIK